MSNWTKQTNKLFWGQGISTTVIILITVWICFTTSPNIPIEEQGIRAGALSIATIAFPVAISLGMEVFLAIIIAFISNILVLIVGCSFVAGYGFAPYTSVLGIENYAVAAAGIAVAITFSILLAALDTGRKIGKKEMVSTLLTTVLNFTIFYLVPGLI